MSASPKPPAIPPQPQFQSNDSLFLSLKTPPPPPRRYQLVPIRNGTNFGRPVSDAFVPFGKMARGTYDSERRDYENSNVICDDVDRKPVIVSAIPKTASDERRKPYYYNELNIMLANDLMQLTSFAEESDANASPEARRNGTNGAAVAGDNDECDDDDDELARNTMFNANLISCGSGNSLDNVV